MITIVAAGGNNFASIEYAMQRLGRETCTTRDPDLIKAASHVILPGVGTAHQAMRQLHEFHLIEVIRQLQQPVLGICLGMQILYELSAEGNVDCLNIVPGKVQALPPKSPLPLPHMGWNQIKLLKTECPLLAQINDPSYLYYVHSFAAPINAYTVAVTDYTIPFAAMVQKDNFYGMQFHPERSGAIGTLLLRNFLELA